MTFNGEETMFTGYTFNSEIEQENKTMTTIHSGRPVNDLNSIPLNLSQRRQIIARMRRLDGFSFRGLTYTFKIVRYKGKREYRLDLHSNLRIAGIGWINHLGELNPMPLYDPAIPEMKNDPVQIARRFFAYTASRIIGE